jgi:hypothetical protein
MVQTDPMIEEPRSVEEPISIGLPSPSSIIDTTTHTLAPVINEAMYCLHLPMPLFDSSDWALTKIYDFVYQKTKQRLQIKEVFRIVGNSS